MCHSPYDAGEITGFIGRNGAGKTTTIKSMLNLVHPDSGDIRYFGMSLVEHEAEIKRKIGYSTGSITWYPRRKITDIVEVVKQFFDTWDEEAYAKYLEMFGLDENKTARELSEGMKVKCHLLIALSHRAKVLILDEPTSGLDPFSRDELLELFIRAQRKKAWRFSFQTHIISDIEKCADNIVLPFPEAKSYPGTAERARFLQRLLRKMAKVLEDVEFYVLEKEVLNG